MQTALAVPRNTRAFPASFDAVLSMLEQGINQIDSSGYPPHNIYRVGTDDFYIEMAVAGFTREDFEITVDKSTLTVATKPAADNPDEGRVYLHKGLARRAFRRSFRLGEYMVVKGAEMTNGLLRIHVARELPEEAKPRQIEISVGA